jgi:hypothetical protein
VKRIVLAALVTVAGAVFASAAAHSSGAATRSACGGDRWTVKTLQDRPHLRPARTTTVHFLITWPAPSNLPATRLPFEHRVFTVIAAVVLVRSEADSDLHVVLQSGGNHMITEAPSPSCDRHATPDRRQQMRVARNHVRLCARARVTGVAFFDFPHGQTGVAPNAIELHPILAFRCLSG